MLRSAGLASPGTRTFAHCGGHAEGAFLYTLSLIDVAPGWTECLPLRFRTQETVIQALDCARTLLPFALEGLDTDNGSEFLNAELYRLAGGPRRIRLAVVYQQLRDEHGLAASWAGTYMYMYWYMATYASVSAR